MQPLAYLHLQMRLEGKEVYHGCLMRQVEVLADEEMPLILIARLANQDLVIYYDEAVSADLQKELTVTDMDFPKVDSFMQILKSHHIQFEPGYYKTYIFPAQPAIDADVKCLSKRDSKVKDFGFDGFAEKVYAIECNGSLVSACVSIREDERCGEAWVYTAPVYRQLGFAQKVVSAWARDLMDAGKVPFYSHNLENEPSANLARKLGLQPVFEEISIIEKEANK
jgi:RimJ/RimL family protein N-acetyltransferase